LHQFVLIKLKI